MTTPMPITALLLAAGALFAAGPAAADSLACQTVNGQTHCLQGSGTLSCQTIGGRTHCSATPDGRDGAAGAPSPAVPSPAIPDVREILARQGVSVERHGTSVHVRTGTVDVRTGMPDMDEE